jgi:VanZ like family
VITNVLLDHPWLSPTALGILIVLGPFVGAWLAARTWLAWLLAGASTLPVAVLTLVPVRRELFARCTIQWALPTPGRVELFANVVLFVAPVLLAGVATRRPMVVLIAGSGASAALEAVQALVPAIGRSCDTNDWMSNTIGAITGAVLAWTALYLAQARLGLMPSARLG